MINLNKIALGLIIITWAELFIFSSPVKSESETHLADRIVAVVNDEAITLSELNEFSARLRLSLELPVSLVSQETGRKDEALNQLILRRLQIQLAQRRGLRISSQEIDLLLAQIARENGLFSENALKDSLKKEGLTLSQYREDIKKQLMILKLAGREVKSGILISEEEIRLTYQDNLDEYRLPDKVHLRQILLPLPSPSSREQLFEKARSIRSQFLDGKSFDSLAREHSQGPNAGSGGDLGMIEVNQLMPKVAQALSKLNPGEITEPIETLTGIQLFWVESIQKDKHRPLAKVKESIHEALFQAQATERYLSWAREIRNQSHVEIMF